MITVVKLIEPAILAAIRDNNRTRNNTLVVATDEITVDGGSYTMSNLIACNGRCSDGSVTVTVSCNGGTEQRLRMNYWGKWN